MNMMKRAYRGYLGALKEVAGAECRSSWLACLAILLAAGEHRQEVTHDRYPTD